MSLINLTKQFAEQTITKQLKDAVDLTTGTPETVEKPVPAFGELLLRQLQSMQKALKDDQELHVTCAAGKDSVRVLEVYVPAWPLLVITGANAEKAIVRVVTHAETAQFICKVVKVPADVKPARINCILPK
jgi:hypothetical protein